VRLPSHRKPETVEELPEQPREVDAEVSEAEETTQKLTQSL